MSITRAISGRDFFTAAAILESSWLMMRAISRADLVSKPIEASLELSVVRSCRPFGGSFCDSFPVPVSVCKVVVVAMLVYSAPTQLHNFISKSPQFALKLRLYVSRTQTTFG